MGLREEILDAVVDVMIHVSMQDVDAARIHFASVFNYFDRNETQLCAALGVPISAMLANGLAMPVVAVNCEYLDAFGLDDQVRVVSRVVDIGRSSLKIGHSVSTPEGKDLARATITHVCVDVATNTAIPFTDLFSKMGVRGT